LLSKRDTAPINEARLKAADATLLRMGIEPETIARERRVYLVDLITYHLKNGNLHERKEFDRLFQPPAK